MNNKNNPDEQSKGLNTNNRKLPKITNSRQILWPFALFWTAFAINSYRQHGFSWIEGFVVGLWIYSAFTELVGIYRRRQKDHALKRTARRRGRHKTPLRGVQKLSVLSAAKRYFLASAPPSRAF